MIESSLDLKLTFWEKRPCQKLSSNFEGGEISKLFSKNSITGSLILIFKMSREKKENPVITLSIGNTRESLREILERFDFCLKFKNRGIKFALKQILVLADSLKETSEFSDEFRLAIYEALERLIKRAYSPLGLGDLELKVYFEKKVAIAQCAKMGSAALIIFFEKINKPPEP